MNEVAYSIRPHRKPVVSQLLYLLGLLFLAVMLAFSLTNFIRLAKAALVFPYSIDFAEGPVLNQTLGLSRGENIYHSDFSVPPYTVSNYPPIYQLVQVPFIWIFGPAYWYGRMISMICALLTSLFIGLVLYSLSGDRVASVIGGLIFLAFPYVQIFSNFNRIDLLALTFSWAAILVVIDKVDHRWGVPLAAALFVVSIYTRHSYGLAGPGATFAWLLITRRPHQAFRLALLTGGAGLTLFILLNLLTHGGFYLNIVTANIHSYYWEGVTSRMIRFHQYTRFLVYLAGLFMVAGWLNKGFPTWAFVLPYVIGAGLSTLTIGKAGSDLNHLLEMVAALSFTAGASLAWLGRFGWIRLMIFVGLAIQVFVMTNTTIYRYNKYFLFSEEYKVQVAELARLVRDTDGIVLADHYMGLISLTGKRIYFQPFDYKMLSDNDLWDQQPLIDEIQERHFSLIIMSLPLELIKERWTPEMIEAVDIYYRRERVLSDAWVFVPR